MASSSLLSQPLPLPNGSVLANRIGKASMEESLCNANHGPSQDLIALYKHGPKAARRYCLQAM